MDFCSVVKGFFKIRKCCITKQHQRVKAALMEAMMAFQTQQIEAEIV